MKEKTIEEELVSLVTRRGRKCLKLEESSRRGFPDRAVFDHGGRILFVETKTEIGKLSPQQRATIAWLRKFGFQVEIPKTKEEVQALVAQFFNGNTRSGWSAPREVPRSLGASANDS